jgi:hypothetical protein
MIFFYPEGLDKINLRDAIKIYQGMVIGCSPDFLKCYKHYTASIFFANNISK